MLAYIEDCENGDCESFPEDQIPIAENYRGRSICTRWHTLTPGNQIAQQVTKAVGLSQDQLLLADELNENIGLIFDALLNQMFVQGLRAFSEADESNVAWAQMNNLQPGADFVNTVEFNDVIGGDPDDLDNPEDGFVGVVPTQETYIELLENLITQRQAVIQRTYDLDYCVPGPNPLWQPQASDAVAQYFSQLPVELNPILANQLYTPELNTILGVAVDSDDLIPIINSYNMFVNFVSEDIFMVYADLVNDRFTTSFSDFEDNVRQRSIDFYLNLENVIQTTQALQQNLQDAQTTLSNLLSIREEYAPLEYEFIIQELNNLISEGQNSVADNLEVFEAFTSNQITYIGQGDQNSPYHDAVLDLADELGYFISPPANNPQYIDILDQFADILDGGVATENQIFQIENELQETISILGDPSNIDSLVGTLASCVNQVNEVGPYQGVDFDGFTERLPYPFPISNDLGLPSLDTTETFLEDIIVSFDPNPRSFDLVSDDINEQNGTEYTDDVSNLEDFMNLGNSLF